MIFLLLFSSMFVILIIACCWFESTEWKFCRGCRKFWHPRMRQRYHAAPRDCDGVVQAQTCPDCLKAIR